MAHLIISCGVPGSGKSTFLNRVFGNKPGENSRYKIVSRDEIRFSLLKPNEPYFAKENETWLKFVREIQSGLDQGLTVIADATHLGGGARHKLLKALRLNGVQLTAIYFDISLETCLERNDMRRGTRAYVPPEKVEQMFHSYSKPRFNEGFTVIFRVDENGEIVKEV